MRDIRRFISKRPNIKPMSLLNRKHCLNSGQLHPNVDNHEAIGLLTVESLSSQVVTAVKFIDG